MRMKIWVALASFVMSFALFTTNAVSQDFTGEWELDRDASELPQQQFGVWSNMSIEEADQQLVVTRTRTGQQGPGPSEQVDTINLEGETVENAWFGDSTRETTAAWEDGVLVVTNVASFNNNSFTTTERYSVNEEGSVLTVEATTPGFGGGGESTSTYVYNKVTE